MSDEFSDELFEATIAGEIYTLIAPHFPDSAADSQNRGVSIPVKFQDGTTKVVHLFVRVAPTTS